VAVDDDDVIDEAVVRIHPSLTTFQSELKKALAKEQGRTKQPVYKVKVVADGTGLKNSVAAAVKKQMALANQPVYKVKVVADASGLKRSIASANSIVTQAAQRTERDVTRTQASALRDRQRAHEQAARDRARVLEREARDQQRAARKQAEERRKTLFTSPQLIDYGGRGVRPTNLLLGVVTAMTPALFAMGTSAAQAASSIAALGSAGIGAALGLSGVMVAFQGIGDVLGLRQQVLNEQTTGAANAARDAAIATDTLAQSKRALADAQRDEKTAADDLHKARREAVRDLEDLRKAVRDLDNEYRGDKLSVAEARQNAIATDQNFFATALDRLRARQDLRDAQTRLSDTALKRKRAREDLRLSVSKGVEGSDKVRAAKERIRDARDARLNAQAALRGAKTTTGGIDKTSSAAAQLKKKIAELSPAAQDMYYWFIKNEEVFKRLQRNISQKVLPGFQTFLDAVTTTPAAGEKTTLQLAAEYAGDLGAIISKYAGKFGVLTKSTLFRSSMARIQERNADAFDKLGEAIITLADPLIRIIDKASPGFTSLADTILKFSIRFSDFIEQADKSGALTQWFEDSRREAAKWFDIAGNILELLKNLFVGALPAGHSLVSSFQEFTQSLADWSSSDKGQRQIKDFFETIKNLPYAKIADFFINATQFFIAFRAFRFLKELNPFLAAFGAFAAANPELAAKAFAVAGKAINETMKFIVAHPQAAGVLLGILAAAKLGKAVGFDIKIPVVNALRDALTSKFKVLEKFTGGGAKTATMTVHAGVVNVYGKGGVGGGSTVVSGDGKSKGRGGRRGGFSGAVGGTIFTLALEELIFGEYGKAAREQTSNALLRGLVTGVKVINSKSLGERLRDPIGSVISDAIGIAAGLFGKQPKKTPGAAPLGVRAAETLGMSRLKNNLESFGKDSAVTRESIANYVNVRNASVKAHVDHIRATQGSIAADKEQQRQDRESKRVLSELLVQYGWTKTAAKQYTNTVFNTAAETQKASDKATAAARSFDSMGNSLDTTKSKAGELNTQVGALKDTVNATIGPHVIALDTKNYDKVYKQLSDLWNIQHVLYNPVYSNSASGADTVSSQNQYLDPLTGKPKKYMKAAGGHILGPGTSTSDSIPAWLSTGEYVMPTKTVQHYGLGVMDQMRKRELPAFAAGGAAMPFIYNLPNKGLQAPAIGLGPGTGGPAFTGKVPKGVGAIGGVNNQMAAAAIDVHRLMGAHVSSGLRPGSITSSGNRSYHGFGRAIDLIPPSMALFNYLVGRYGKFAREIIYSPAGGRQIWNGRQHMYTGDVRADHYDHVHLALAKGGLVPRKYDTGGVLPPGYSLAFNGTGANETVRTDKQEKALAAGATRLDRRDLALLAQYMASATGNPAITMDGRKVAETTNRYNYLPAGV
jgi:hypothetical protein